MRVITLVTFQDGIGFVRKRSRLADCLKMGKRKGISQLVASALLLRVGFVRTTKENKVLKNRIIIAIKMKEGQEYTVEHGASASYFK